MAGEDNRLFSNLLRYQAMPTSNNIQDARTDPQWRYAPPGIPRPPAAPLPLQQPPLSDLAMARWPHPAVGAYPPSDPSLPFSPYFQQGPHPAPPQPLPDMRGIMPGPLSWWGGV
jgi:hypothetical protein